MTNNDVLRTLRHALELTPAVLVDLFAAGGFGVELAHVAAMLKEDDEPGFEPLGDAAFERFLDGLIASRRGLREDGAPRVSARMTNNRVLRALRIAFELRDVDILALMEEAGRTLSKTELGALFRREDHRNYQPCGDQFLRTFLRGLGVWHRAGRFVSRGAP